MPLTLNLAVDVPYFFEIAVNIFSRTYFNQIYKGLRRKKKENISKVIKVYGFGV